jgi:ribosomal protein L40E
MHLGGEWSRIQLSNQPNSRPARSPRRSGTIQFVYNISRRYLNPVLDNTAFAFKTCSPPVRGFVTILLDSNLKPVVQATITVTSTGDFTNDSASRQAKSVIVVIGESSLNVPRSDRLAESLRNAVLLYIEHFACGASTCMHCNARIPQSSKSTCRLCCLLQGCLILSADCGMPRAAQCSRASTSLIQIIVWNLVFEGLVR